MLNIISTSPIIQLYENFLTRKECESLINKDSNTIDLIYDKLSRELKINRLQFESIEIVENPSDEGRLDYFFGAEQAQNRQGGNRTATIVLQLTTPKIGGELYFPWPGILIRPNRGKLTYFEYDDLDVTDRIKSQYKFTATTDGTNWVALIRVREFNTTKLAAEVEPIADFYQQSFQDSIYQLTCGPSDDLRQLNIVLPANRTPGATIIVGFTAGMDSSLLLYLLAQLNKLQKIPYHIQPIIIHNRQGSSDVPNKKYADPILEDWNSLVPMVELIRQKTGTKILDTIMHVASPLVPRENQKIQAMWDFYLRQYGHRFNKYSYIFVGSNQNPTDPGFPQGPRRILSAAPPWMNPFINLEKSHIVDALLQIGCEDMVAISPKCSISHTTLDERCDIWQCMERRWAFKRINKIEVGARHFLQGKNMNYDLTQNIDDLLSIDPTTENFISMKLPTIGTFVLRKDEMSKLYAGGTGTDTGGDVGPDVADSPEGTESESESESESDA
jgi:hypothetical protein